MEEVYGGYDYELVDAPPDRLLCLICTLPSRDPRITECCGQIMCNSCLPGHDQCPSCSEHLVTFPNKQILRGVDNLSIFCTNKAQGCLWQGALQDISSHLEECLLQVVQCNYEDVGCEVKVVHKRKRGHEDESIKEHLELTKRKLHETQSEHQSTKDELAVIEDRVSSLEIVVHQLMCQQSSSVSQQEPSWSIALAAAGATSGTPVCPCIIKMPDFDKLYNNSNEMLHTFFYTHKGGYLMQLCADLADTVEEPHTRNLLIQLCLLEGPYDDQLSWPLRGKFEVCLLNHLSDYQHCSDVFIYDDDHGNRVVESQGDYDELARSVESYPFIKEDELKQETDSRVFIKDNCLYIGIRRI